ncbi:hypothetical protein FE257_010310 [Aspergillus nanangensis]|uniref:FAD binding domain protein n=1 Tax=Aspergillus nanangensis TaxID=2582783 RepID=A0AAD4CIV4_ASPNN|nr:hypothetical protein FE257_010310 [Aspergillus nanangensis]
MTDQNCFDVVIVGAGPAGLIAATWMAQTGIRTLVVEKKPIHTQAGHADGLESRTLEVLDSFGLGERIWAETNRTIEVCLWSTSSLHGGISRDSVQANCTPGLSRFQEATLGQGRIEEHLLQFVGRHPNVHILWDTVPTSFIIHNHLEGLSSQHAIEMHLTTAKSKNGVLSSEKTPAPASVRAKYLVGCDGAHSWVRQQLGLRLEGCSRENCHWGVIDCVPVTNFPDIRKRCIIKSNVGSVMIIPREDTLVRIYIELSPATAAQFRSNWYPSVLLTVLGDVLKPYYLVTSDIPWSTIYTVGQRICHQFSVHDRVFLAGDAVHTHSPKAGQGMNVSMQDSYNLGWKLASVLRGAASPQILRTYQEERLPIADRLIKFDRRMCRGICSSRYGEDEEPDQHHQQQQADPSHEKDKYSKLKDALSEENSSAAGLAATYAPGLLVTPAGSPHSPLCLDIPSSIWSKSYLAQNIVLGRRLLDTLVLCQSDSRPWHLQQKLPSTGQWHLLVFGGDITASTQMARVMDLAASLSHPLSAVAGRINAADPVGSIAVYLVHSAPRLDVQLADLPLIFRPLSERTGYDYGRVFADNKGYQDGTGRAYKVYGIASEGCMVLLRPDQHCAYIGALEDTPALEAFFERFTTVDE